MKDRPEIDQRVRVLGNTGVNGVAGKIGRVSRHHPDGQAFTVVLEDVRAGERSHVVCDPCNVEPAPVHV